MAINYTDILNGERGLSVRTKLNEVLKALTEGDEGVNKAHALIKSLNSSLANQATKEENDYNTLVEAIRNSDAYTDSQIANVINLISAMGSGIGGIIPTLSFNPSGFDSSVGIVLFTGLRGTFTNFKDSSNTAITISGTLPTLTLFYRAPNVTYWDYQSIEIDAIMASDVSFTSGSLESTNVQDAIDELSDLTPKYDIETDNGLVKNVQLKDGQGNRLMPRTDAEVVDVVDTELSYTTLVNNKYIHKNGVEVSQNGQTYGYGEIGDVKKVRVKWTSFSNVQNYSIIAFYTSDDFTQTPISKLVGMNGVTTGEKIVDVPEGAVYFAYSLPTKVTLTVYTSDALTYVKDMRKELMSLGMDYNHFDGLELVERVASTYLSRGGAVVYGSSWSAYAIRAYAVVPGQVVYFYHPIAWNTGLAVYGFANSYASGTQCKAYEADISQSVTPKYDGSFKRLVVPDGCQYLIVNELAAVGEKAFTHIKVLGTPRHVDLHKVKNYNPCFDLSSPVWAQQIGALDQWISGLGCSFTGAEQLKYPIVVEDSNDVFADTGATHYLECLQQMRVGPGCRFFYMYSKDFSNAFRKNKTLRVEFDLQIDSDAAIAIKFNSYCYLNGSTSGLGGTQYEQTFQPGVVTHVDRIFYYSNLPLENGFIQFNLVHFTAAQLSHITSVKIANLVITDDIQQLNIPTQEAYRPTDWLGRNRYFNKRCLFIGDSISTSGTWVWKNVLNWRYGLRSEDRKSSSDMSIAPAEGSITIAASNKEGNSRSSSYSNKMSIWYKCAYHRMDIYDFDVISLFGGTNDAWWDDTLYPGGVGTADDIPYVDDASTFADPSKYTDVYSDNLTFMQFYKGCIEMLRRDFPDKELILSTLFPLNSNYRLDYQIAEGKTCRRDEWVSYLILQVARKYNLKCNAWYWNMYPPAGWSGNVNIGAIIHHDGVHPSVVDGYMMADRFATALGC